MNATSGDFFAVAQRHMTVASYLNHHHLPTGTAVAAIGAARQLSSITAQLWEFLAAPASTRRARERLFLALVAPRTIVHLRAADDLLPQSVKRMFSRFLGSHETPEVAGAPMCASDLSFRWRGRRWIHETRRDRFHGRVRAREFAEGLV
ncbi:hypothetical protein [Streptosporangium sp. CA-115845]|uniref:hypothetical protein n=1 Tax=Streptosporangium sp. CA-115845 TaxID=3240071 RepID=UPI003D8AA5E3